MITNNDFIFRLFLAGILGAMIGLEREFRAKEAGIRTHFLVSLGSVLFMMVSQWGFQTSVGVEGLRGADQARVAAQIVSGIGFLGAGTIMMQKQSVKGLTTAAGLWVTAAIGMAIGGGLYLVGCVATFFALLGLELFRFLIRNIKVKSYEFTFTTKSRESIFRLMDALNKKGCKVMHYSATNALPSDNELLRVQMYLHLQANQDRFFLMQETRLFPDVLIEKIE